MIPFLLAYAYPGECARLMVEHPGVESFAPWVAVATLLCIWGIVWLIFRNRLAATASAAVLFCMPAFRLGLQHPLRQNLILCCALIAVALGLGIFRLVRGWREKDENDYHSLARLIAFSGLSLLALASLSCLRLLNVHLAALASVVAGISLGHWWLGRKTSMVSKIAFWLLSFIFAFSCVFELCTADWREGEFADRIAEAILDDMGDRSWIVTDGSLDDHLKLAARARGREIHIISLVRDSDKEYRKELAAMVREQKLAGDACEELVLSLDLGVLQFVMDWLKTDPLAAKQCVIFGVADLWYSAGINPVPERLFFGGDEKRSADWSKWSEFDALLEVPKGWGSYRVFQVTDPVELLRLGLRRHLGMVANNRGVWLQDHGQDAEAYEMYRLVMDDIDRDNLSVLFNLLSMASARFAPAEARRKEIDERFKKIIADKNRRYMLGAMSRFYGYIRNPDTYVRLGFEWARSGMPGTAMAQIRRAIDLVPSDRRGTLVNMLASLYANEQNAVKSREAYETVLREDGRNHEALIGMMRLALMEGDQQKALEYLERAVEAGGDDPRIDIERATLAMMKNQLNEATAILRHCVDRDEKDLRAWAMLSSVLMQLCDAEQDAEKRKAIEKELSGTILPKMVSNAADPNDYYVNSTKAFLLLRKGDKFRKEARDAFVIAARARPDIVITQDLVLGLDIALDDRENAAIHARDALRFNRKSPIANYVMGSIALDQDDLKSAEMYLKRAADAAKPVDLAINDLAEAYRRQERLEEALKYAEKAVAANDRLYVARETLATVLMDLGRDYPKALTLVNEALELSKVNGHVSDPRMYITLARAQFLSGDVKAARISLRKSKSMVDKLSGYEKRQYEELLKRVR